MSARRCRRLALLSWVALLGQLASAEAVGAAPLHAAPPHGSGLSAGAIAIVAVAGLAVLACAAWGLARWQAFEPRWTHSLRHAVSEAGLRVSSTWSEFADWLRLGH